MARLHLFLAGLFVATGLLSTACSEGGAQIDFSRYELQTPVSAAQSPATDTLRMAVAPVLSPRANSDLYEQLADYLGQKLGRPAELVQGQTYAEINDLVKSGDVTLALVCTNPYLQGRDDFGMELLAAPEVNGETSYYSLLIAARGLPASSLAGLRGKTFAFTDPLSNSGRLAPLYQLSLLGASPDSFFSRSIFTYSHDSSVRAVAEGIVDAAAVDSLVFDYLRTTEPSLTEKVDVIEKWGPFGINPLVVNPRLDPRLKGELRTVLLNMEQDAQGKRILHDLSVDRFVVPDDHIYDSVREMRSYLRQRGLGP